MGNTCNSERQCYRNKVSSQQYRTAARKTGQKTSLGQYTLNLSPSRCPEDPFSDQLNIRAALKT